MPERHAPFLRITPLLLMLIALCFQTSLFAQNPPLWGDLTPGQYGIGFRTIEKYDYSRTFRPKFNYFGDPLPDENARPIQICYWYPAAVSPDDYKISYAEYIFPNPDDPDFFNSIRAPQQRELQAIAAMLGNSQGLMLDANNIEMAAVRDASPLEGPFPLIIYFPDLTAGISDNMVLCEFLASHGFVVATTHQIGLDQLNPDADQVGLESIIRDKEFALAIARDLEFIDKDNIGVLGTGCGGLTALITQMRNYDIDAVASLGGWNIVGERLGLSRQNPFFNVRRTNRPLLQMFYEDEMFNLSLLDSCKYADRYTVKLASATIGSFSAYGAVQARIGDTLNILPAISRPLYDATCLYVLNFFKAFLNKDGTALAFMKGSPSDNNLSGNVLAASLLPAATLPPTAAQFVDVVRTLGGVKAVQMYHQFEKTDPGSITFTEATINILGYQALQAGQNEDAVALFKLNAETYPNSANCWDSYADGLQAIGDNEGALQCYRKVLEALPNDTQIGEGLKQTLQTNAETGIERLSN